MVQIRTADAILSDLVNFLRASTLSTDLSDNAVLRDLSLFPTAVAGELILGELDKAVSLQLIDRLADEDLDNEGTFNFGSPRKQGRAAVGTVFFATATEPSTDLIIPQGVVVTTGQAANQSSISFVTVETITLPFATRANFYDPQSETWRVEVTIQAVLEGLSGVVNSYAINTIRTPIQGLDLVYNEDATYNGVDVEIDAEYRNRLKKKVKGRELGQREGIEEFLLENFSFPDAGAITVNDLDSERVEGTDIFVIDSSYTQTQDSFVYQTGVSDYTLLNQPTLVVTEVSSLARGLLIENIDYEVIEDTTSSVRFSTLAQSKIRVLPAASLPNLDTLTVTYAYASDTVSAQALIDQPKNDLVSADPLVKKAISYLVDMVITVTFLANTDIIAGRSQIQAALSGYLSAFKLGQDVQLSDVIIVLQQGYGKFPVTFVDQVIVRSWGAVSEFGTIVNPVSEQIAIPDIGYTRFGSLTFA